MNLKVYSIQSQLAEKCYELRDAGYEFPQHATRNKKNSPSIYKYHDQKTHITRNSSAVDLRTA